MTTKKNITANSRSVTEKEVTHAIENGELAAAMLLPPKPWRVCEFPHIGSDVPWSVKDADGVAIMDLSSEALAEEVVRVANMPVRELYNIAVLAEDVVKLWRSPIGNVNESASTCPGYGSLTNGFTCGRQKDDDAKWCDRCQDSADLDEKEEKEAQVWRDGTHEEVFIPYPHLMDRD